jgi:hypothetical protein
VQPPYAHGRAGMPAPRRTSNAHPRLRSRFR